MMKKSSLEAWREEAKVRFGEDINKWAFKCPACGHIATIKDFIDAGSDCNSAYQECIGRVNGKGKPPSSHSTDGCDWAAFGLFGTLGEGRLVVNPSGKEVEVFEFADGDPMSQEGTETNVIKLRYLKDGEPQGKAYTYYTPIKVAVGDRVELVAFKAGIAQGVVTEINVPQEEIGVFKDKAKSIIGKASLKG